MEIERRFNLQIIDQATLHRQQMEALEAKHRKELADLTDGNLRHLKELQDRNAELTLKVEELNAFIVKARFDQRLEIPPPSTAHMECSYAKFVKDLHQANISHLHCQEGRFNKLLEDVRNKNAELLEV